ncbi:MAG: AzlC family ABC transporter permease [Qingshengfaniella sp.]
MATSTTKSAFWQGLFGGAPFLLVICPFAILFGVAGTEAGLTLAEVMGFSVLVIAGAAQFTAVQLMTEHTPTVIVLIASLAVNLRMAMYSAAMVPYLGAAPLWQRALVAYGLVDQSYALSVAKYQASPDMDLPRRLAFFGGIFVSVGLPWYVMTWVGAVAGTAIPPEMALDFAIPITFLAMVAPALRSLPHIVAALVSALGALVLNGLPYGMGLILAAIAAMAAGATTEHLLEKTP